MRDGNKEEEKIGRYNKESETVKENGEREGNLT